MTASVPTAKHANGAGPAGGAGSAGGAGRAIGGVALGAGSGRDARRVAAAVLEVLAGARTPTEAAAALAVSVPRYYQLESRALQGLLAACAARPKGRQRSAETELAAVRRQAERLQRELTRQQTLLRAAQRAVGLAAPAAAPSGKDGKKPARKARRCRVARALGVAARLKQQDDPAGAAPTPEASNVT
jgi:hypothetical protein